jgi:hypothetical protein
MSSFMEEPELPTGFDAVRGLPPGIGIVRFEDKEGRLRDGQHFTGFGAALDQALFNFGHAPGRYRVEVSFSATVEVHNPGVIIEYAAKLHG